MKRSLIKNRDAFFTPKAFCQFQGRRKEGGEGDIPSVDSPAQIDYKNWRFVMLCLWWGLLST